MRPGALFLNLSRGFVVDYAALRAQRRVRAHRRRRRRRLPGRAQGPRRRVRLRAARAAQRHPHPAHRRVDRGGAAGHRPLRRRQVPRLRADGSTVDERQRAGAEPAARRGHAAPGPPAPQRARRAGAGQRPARRLRRQRRGASCSAPAATSATSSPTAPAAPPRRSSTRSGPCPRRSASASSSDRRPRDHSVEWRLSRAGYATRRWTGRSRARTGTGPGGTARKGPARRGPRAELPIGR